MSKVSSDKYSYDYKQYVFNLDRNDPSQKACIEFLDKIGRNKNKLFALLIHQFMNQFKEPDKITPKDIKNYLEFCDLNLKLKEPSGITPLNLKELTTTSELSSISPSTKEDTNKSDDNVDNTDLIAAVDMFSV